MKIKNVFVSVVLVLVVAMGVQATIVNTCDNLAAFTYGTPDGPGDVAIVAGGGPDSSNCLQFVPRDSGATHSVTWDFPDVAVTGSDTFSFDVRNFLEGSFGSATLFVWIYLNGSSDPYSPSNVGGVQIHDSWAHFNVALPNDALTVQKVVFASPENVHLIRLDNLVVTPEPTTMAILGLGFLLLRRKHVA